MREAVSTKQHSDTNTPSTAPIPSTSPSEKPREMSSAVDSASTEAQPKDGRDGGNQGLANTTENRGAEAEEPAKNVPWGRTTAYTEVDGLSERYPMNHRPRGAALIFAHSEFLDKSLNVKLLRNVIKTCVRDPPPPTTPRSREPPSRPSDSCLRCSSTSRGTSSWENCTKAFQPSRVTARESKGVSSSTTWPRTSRIMPTLLHDQVCLPFFSKSAGKWQSSTKAILSLKTNITRINKFLTSTRRYFVRFTSRGMPP
ncbi:uncharacterized protein LOC134782171 isoform X1 [Penaeus indicus]|uniref:uncharacterized protein LOC134782171 isoform X1 n=1 Tax=Penaeus indicus TaxID=29960 RepID=UPI00300D602A